ncbi:unnamed protein product [Mytilus edulis]|uniref:Uncharacterized protein n=1 Tax=Mytilus edulis TaxID=6550 RepID=A0A8S3SN89_MYTED|nr:unnamed protein product [Mytilus edulis]
MEGAAEIKIPIVKACLVQDGRLKADAVKKDRVAFVSIKPCSRYKKEDFRPSQYLIRPLYVDKIKSDSLPNGMVNVTERNFGSTANFSCNEGYILEGKQSITCLQSGWNGEIPQCHFQCADIQSDSLPNGLVTLMERHVGSTANFSCNEGYLLDGNHSHNMHAIRMEWRDSTMSFRVYNTNDINCKNRKNASVRENCNARGGHLTSIGTGDENTYLLEVLKLMKDIQNVTAYFWIGLTDNNDEMSYKWLSGEPLNYSDWFQGPPQQPDNLNFANQQGAHCALINPSLHWIDEFCASLLYSICEIR